MFFQEIRIVDAKRDTTYPDMKYSWGYESLHHIFRFVSLLDAALFVEFIFASLLDAQHAGLLPLIRSRFPAWLVFWRWLSALSPLVDYLASSMLKISREHEMEKGAGVYWRRVLHKGRARGGYESEKEARFWWAQWAPTESEGFAQRDTAISGKL